MLISPKMQFIVAVHTAWELPPTAGDEGGVDWFFLFFFCFSFFLSPPESDWSCPARDRGCCGPYEVEIGPKDGSGGLFGGSGAGTGGI